MIDRQPRIDAARRLAPVPGIVSAGWPRPRINADRLAGRDTAGLAPAPWITGRLPPAPDRRPMPAETLHWNVY